MRIADLCTRSVVTCRRDTSALELAQLMRDRHVGDVIVVDVDPGGSTPVGIVTDRDMVVRVMAKGVDPNLVLGVLTADDVTRFLAEELTELSQAVPHQRKLEQRALDPPAKP